MFASIQAVHSCTVKSYEKFSKAVVCNGFTKVVLCLYFKTGLNSSYVFDDTNWIQVNFSVTEKYHEQGTVSP